MMWFLFLIFCVFCLEQIVVCQLASSCTPLDLENSFSIKVGNWEQLNPQSTDAILVSLNYNYLGVYYWTPWIQLDWCDCNDFNRSLYVSYPYFYDYIFGTGAIYSQKPRLHGWFNEDITDVAKIALHTCGVDGILINEIIYHLWDNSKKIRKKYVINQFEHSGKATQEVLTNVKCTIGGNIWLDQNSDNPTIIPACPTAIFDIDKDKQKGIYADIGNYYMRPMSVNSCSKNNCVKMDYDSCHAENLYDAVRKEGEIEYHFVIPESRKGLSTPYVEWTVTDKIIGKICSNMAPGTKPLYYVQENHKGEVRYSDSWTGPSWSYILIGYIYQNQVHGSHPIYQQWRLCDRYFDNLLTTSKEPINRCYQNIETIGYLL